MCFSLLPFYCRWDVLALVHRIYFLLLCVVVRWRGWPTLASRCCPPYAYCFFRFSCMYYFWGERILYSSLQNFNLLILMDDSTWYRTNTYPCCCTSLIAGNCFRYSCPSGKESGCSNAFPFFVMILMMLFIIFIVANTFLWL